MTRDAPAPGVTLREVEDADLPLFFAMMRDPVATRMAAFTPEDPGDREGFDAHWRRIRAPECTDVLRTVLADGRVAGMTALYGPVPGEREVTYWVDRALWGRGIATRALRALLALVPDERPVRASAAADNAGSLRVLRACGFEVTGTGTSHANARGGPTAELHLVLR
ncbi:GNAT family N-acetyltransferase [Streptomyces sp. 8L]|uniref:GNAT family N-acetyltransferase n=1 Tax=Streptomyces sp. 8L TaxID=2877242 RepID=UPI001CD8128A|nr:GNAT family N-acetyltransferase [Streptomyces sp. 8L]MCA1222955.1 GNAT family N-acetyltransferase [Streptomyces sp. 8L]